MLGESLRSLYHCHQQVHRILMTLCAHNTPTLTLTPHHLSNTDKYVHRTRNRNDSVISVTVVLFSFLCYGHSKTPQKMGKNKSLPTYAVGMIAFKRVRPSKSMSKSHNEWIVNLRKKNTVTHSHSHTYSRMHPILWWKILCT